jgi:hypothetical protein
LHVDSSVQPSADVKIQYIFAFNGLEIIEMYKWTVLILRPHILNRNKFMSKLFILLANYRSARVAPLQVLQKLHFETRENFHFQNENLWDILLLIPSPSPIWTLLFKVNKLLVMLITL